MFTVQAKALHVTELDMTNPQSLFSTDLFLHLTRNSKENMYVLAFCFKYAKFIFHIF